MIHKFFCMIGWHTWEWSVLKSGWGDGFGNPPDDAECIHCGIRYKDK